MKKSFKTYYSISFLNKNLRGEKRQMALIKKTQTKSIEHLNYIISKVNFHNMVFTTIYKRLIFFHFQIIALKGPAIQIIIQFIFHSNKNVNNLFFDIMKVKKIF